MFLKLINKDTVFYYPYHLIFNVQVEKIENDKYKVKIIFLDTKQPPIAHIVDDIKTVDEIGDKQTFFSAIFKKKYKMH